MQRRFKKFLKDHQWLIIGVLWVATFLLGYIGVRKQLTARDEIWSLWDPFYRSLQLFILEDSVVVSSPILSWELEIARFLSPAVTAYTAIAAVLVVFRERLQAFRLRHIKDHVVICGMGQKGLLLAKGFHEKGNRIVVIEKDTDNDNLEHCREHGMIVLIGNATDRGLLQKAHVQKARYLISVCGDGGVNAEVAVHAREMVRDRKGKVLTCLVHIVNPQLCSLLREQEIATQRADLFRLEFFNVFESGARAMLNEYPGFGEKQIAEGHQPHLLIVGLGRMGESMVVHAARQWRDIHPPTAERLRISIIDETAEQKKESLYLRYLGIEKVCDLIPIQMDINSPEFQHARFLFDSNGYCNVAAVYVCLDDDSSGLSAALALHQRLRDHSIPIVVRMTHDAGLATLLQGEEESSFESLHAFGLLDQTCKPDLLLGGTNEIIASAVHEEFVRHLKEKGETPQTHSSIVSWDELPEHLKESNRRQADHIGIKLKAVGCSIAPLTDWDAVLFQFTSEEIELMAEMEHERWVKERLDDGWRYGTERDVEKKISPYLVPWSHLSEEIKEFDRNTIRGLPAFLAKAGFQIYRVK